MPSWLWAMVRLVDKTSGWWKTGEFVSPDDRGFSCKMCEKRCLTLPVWTISNINTVVPVGELHGGNRATFKSPETKRISAASPALRSTQYCEEGVHHLDHLGINYPSLSLSIIIELSFYYSLVEKQIEFFFLKCLSPFINTHFYVSYTLHSIYLLFI